MRATGSILATDITKMLPVLGSFYVNATKTATSNRNYSPSLRRCIKVLTKEGMDIKIQSRTRPHISGGHSHLVVYVFSFFFYQIFPMSRRLRVKDLLASSILPQFGVIDFRHPAFCNSEIFRRRSFGLQTFLDNVATYCPKILFSLLYSLSFWRSSWFSIFFHKIETTQALRTAQNIPGKKGWPLNKFPLANFPNKPIFNFIIRSFLWETSSSASTLYCFGSQTLNKRHSGAAKFPVKGKSEMAQKRNSRNFRKQSRYNCWKKMFFSKLISTGAEHLLKQSKTSEFYSGLGKKRWLASPQGKKILRVQRNSFTIFLIKKYLRVSVGLWAKTLRPSCQKWTLRIQ